MKAKDEVNRYVVRRLEEWGDWHTRYHNNGLGFSRRNIIARLSDEGGVIINGTGYKHLPTHIEAEEIEELVRRIFKQYEDRGIVLHIRYLHPERHEFEAKRIGYTRVQYYSHLKLAHEWIKGYLSAKIKFNYF